MLRWLFDNKCISIENQWLRFTVHRSLYIINFSIAFTVKPSTQPGETETGGVGVKCTCYIYSMLFDVDIQRIPEKKTEYMSWA